jgi:hypothetical protein
MLTLDSKHDNILACGMEERFHLHTIRQILWNQIPPSILLLGIYFKNCLVYMKHTSELVRMCYTLDSFFNKYWLALSTPRNCKIVIPWKLLKKYLFGMYGATQSQYGVQYRTFPWSCCVRERPELEIGWVGWDFHEKLWELSSFETLNKYTKQRVRGSDLWPAWLNPVFCQRKP